MSEMYSPVKGPVRHDEDVLQGDVKTITCSREEIERMLEERWPGQIRPIKVPLHRTPPRMAKVVPFERKK